MKLPSLQRASTIHFLCGLCIWQTEETLIKVRITSGLSECLSFTPHQHPGESLPSCRGLWGIFHTGDDIDCNTCLPWEC